MYKRYINSIIIIIIIIIIIKYSWPPYSVIEQEWCTLQGNHPKSLMNYYWFLFLFYTYVDILILHI